ncbi:MAG: bifunctional diguanylate cyclase/phosphodiesterase, partial [Myxococcota bacterium]
VADALRGAVRPYDTVARTGGDEFVVLLEDLADPVEARSVAARLVSAVASVDAHPEGPVTVSVGVSLFPGCGDTDEQLLAAADAAMYEAKLRGKNQAYVVGQPVAGRIRAPTTAQELHEAIDAGTLDLEYQPQVDLESQELRGLEALVRWRSPDGGPFDASVFVANLERAEAIAELDLWVLEIAREKLCLHPDLQVAVNLSPQTLLHEELAQRLESRPVSNRCIEIELTERFVPLDSKMLTERLHLLQNLGFRVALDDFGVGGSSLARFSKSPVDTLKIDQSFVAGIDADPRNRSIVSSLVFLAELEGLHVVAEGVETEAEYRTLRDLGVRQGQGFYFGHPKPLDAFQAWAKSA